jgi:hypothetical protein
MINKSLALLNPELAKEWHPFKNGTVTPNDVRYGSTVRYWWRCSKNPEHEWEASPNNRRKSNCPYCSNKRACKDNCLATVRPDLVKEWHPTKNENLTPSDFTYGSGKKVWWLCDKGHEWQMAIKNRFIGQGCKKCGHNQTSFPEQAVFYYLSQIFDKTYNRYKLKKIEIDVYVEDINLAIEYDGRWFHSSKKSIKRDENKNKFLSDKEIPLIRIREEGCPEISNYGHTHLIVENPNNELSLTNCIKKLLIMINNQYRDKFTTTEKELAIKRIVDSISINKDRIKILELYKTTIYENSIAVKSPHLVKEWHPTKNGTLKPENFPHSSNIRVWWQCTKNPQHEWETTPAHRKYTGCPFCSGRYATSETCLAKARPDLAKEWHPNKNRFTTPDDVCSSSNKTFWWKCSKGHEYSATINNRSNGKGCPFCANRKVCLDNCLATLRPDLAKEWHPTKNLPVTPLEVLSSIKKEVWWKCSKGHEWQATINSRNGGKGCPECGKAQRIKTRTRIAIEKQGSLATNYPNIAKEWDKSKNGNLLPEDVVCGSDKKIWWLCDKCGNSWDTEIRVRIRSGCPECAKKEAIKKRITNQIKQKGSLADNYPHILTEWDYELNTDIFPNMLLSSSHMTVYWKCSSCKKPYPRQVKDQTKNNSKCPFCKKIINNK